MKGVADFFVSSQQHKIQTMSKKELLLGDEALALGALHAGLSGVYAYPGTPSTEITEYIQGHPLAAARGVHSVWSSNEKTAMEEALGMSFAGKRALVCMKHVGMNVAADAFVNSAMTGANGGLVVVAADDPSMHSSQNEQDSRFYGKFSFIPVFEPASQQEAYDMVREAFDFSEKFRIPVLMRITTRMAHSRAVVETAAVRDENTLAYPDADHTKQWVLMPGNSRRRYATLLDEQEAFVKAFAFNKYIDGTDRSLGIIACGIGYNYLMENFPDGCPHPVLKITQYPLPLDQVRRLCGECEAILVVEDGQPVVEEQLRGIMPTPVPVRGRLSGELPRTGELNPDNVRAAVGLPPRHEYKHSDVVVPRPPALCEGCGHRDVYNVLNEVLHNEYPAAKVFSDIGCYTLGWLAPFHAIDTTVDMGASITMAKGASDAGQHPAVAVIGDSTFTHSGMTGLLDCVRENSNVTIIISDNLTTGMTGGQDSAGTGRLEAICTGLGVDPSHLRTVVPLAKNHAEMATIFRQEINYNGVSVIIPRRECIQTLKRRVPARGK
jgi:indolepyruvate ferredoxin oxidoreductase alpha subunit